MSSQLSLKIILQHWTQDQTLCWPRKCIVGVTVHRCLCSFLRFSHMPIACCPENLGADGLISMAAPVVDYQPPSYLLSLIVRWFVCSRVFPLVSLPNLLGIYLELLGISSYRWSSVWSWNGAVFRGTMHLGSSHLRGHLLCCLHFLDLYCELTVQLYFVFSFPWQKALWVHTTQIGQRLHSDMHMVNENETKAMPSQQNNKTCSTHPGTDKTLHGKWNKLKKNKKIWQ